MSKSFPIRNPELQTKLLPDGHVVVFNEVTLWAHILSPSGAVIWEFCDGQHSLDAIMDEMEALTGTRPEAAVTEQFIADMLENGLIIEL
ncbi:MAG: PqqD family protein [Candidatus Obscuribacterales bacterium]|nr:PqqD family protein [Candidatus Obscuribacterales bacterium]